MVYIGLTWSEQSDRLLAVPSFFLSGAICVSYCFILLFCRIMMSTHLDRDILSLFLWNDRTYFVVCLPLCGWGFLFRNGYIYFFLSMEMYTHLYPTRIPGLLHWFACRLLCIPSPDGNRLLSTGERLPGTACVRALLCRLRSACHWLLQEVY